MSADGTSKIHACVYPNCPQSFARSQDLRRHQRTHCLPEERRFACPVEGCEFRANERGNIKSHHIRMHEKPRLPCSEPDCKKMFSDSSSLRKHQHRSHSGPVESSTGAAERAKRTAMPQYAQVCGKKNEEDVQCAAIVVQAPSSDKRPGSTQSVLSVAFHPARDVKTGHRVSNDTNSELTHQAYDAKHHQAATRAYSYPRDVARLRTQVPTDLPNSSVRAEGDQTGCVAGGPILLAQRGQRQNAPIMMQAEPQISHPTGHVPQGTYYGFQNSTAYYYPSPSPRLLFDSSSR